MTTDPGVPRRLPDIAVEPGHGRTGSLDWVGMDGIEAAVRLVDDAGVASLVPARVDAHVDLVRGDQRGIHMSRIYLIVDRELAAAPLTPRRLREVAVTMLASHADISSRALLRVRYRQLIRRPALASQNSGWRSYPVMLTAIAHAGGVGVELQFDVTYSSTCPASAALSRQLIQDRFVRDFGHGSAVDGGAVHQWLGGSEGIVATPHAQRSTATVRLRLVEGDDSMLSEWIDRVEAALATPVQTAVKRVDEQAFAMRNGQNLMFCEDAARRIRDVLQGDPRVVAFRVRVAHHESLHPHDAVAVVADGSMHVADGDPGNPGLVNRM